MFQDDLLRILGPGRVSFGSEIEARYRKDFFQADHDPICVVRPKSAEEIVEIVRIARREKIPIVPLGGNTGLVGGTIANGSITLSLELMNRIHEVDLKSMTMTVDAGVVLQAAQAAAAEHGLLLPLDIGARGSATIGGNIATNAGGIRVMRWGMARDMVLGLEAVLANGSIVSAMGKAIKNNTGYDWKHLLIGSEGTLGVITRAVLRLRPAPRSAQTAIMTVKDLEEAIFLLHHLNDRLAGTLSSFELMWDGAYAFMSSPRPETRPLPTGYPLYCIVEALGSDPANDDARFNDLLAELLESGRITDAVVAQSERERRAIWAIREGEYIGELLAKIPSQAHFDVGMALADIGVFKQASERRVRAACPDATSLYFGHAGDGNLHVAILSDRKDPDFKHRINAAIYDSVREVSGSVSAEHGIGLSKRDYLRWTRSEPEIALMRAIKQAVDPDNIMNPGKILAEAGSMEDKDQ
jgi:FAD/FMN-containing dehydrogenase